MRHYRFDGQALLPVVAHAGIGHVLTTRVEEAARIGAANFIDLTEVPPGHSIGYHRHTQDNEEIYIVVAGSGHMVVDGVEIRVDAGDVIVNSGGGAHGLVNTGAGRMRIVVVEIPKTPPAGA